MTTKRQMGLMPEWGIMPGQWVTVRSRGIFAALIRWGTNSPVAHAYLYVGPVGPGGADMVQAKPRGFVWGHTTDYPSVQSYPSDPTHAGSSAVAHAIAITGISLANKDTDYNWLADVYLGMQEGLGVHMPRWMFKMASTAKHLECAQAIDYCYLANGRHLFTDARPAGDVSPRDLWGLDYGPGAA